MSGIGIQQGNKVITELKVSGNLMTLDAGLFCIFHSPGTAAPDPATGLPSVRVSLPPNAAPGVVAISTFNPEGWVDQHGAALVRVTHGPAQLLVTVYQDSVGRHDAPKLQVLRLMEGQAVPSAAPAQAPAQVSVQLQSPARAPVQAAPVPPAPLDPAAAELGAHVQVRGDVLARMGEWIGDRGSQRWMEGFVVAPKMLIAPADIEYQAVLGRDWLSPWAEGGQFCGSRGMSLPVLGLRVRLRGEAAKQFDLAVSATFVDGRAVGPLGGGDLCQADSFAPLEAFQVILTPRSSAAARSAPAVPEAAPRRGGAAVVAKPARATAAPPAASAKAASTKAGTARGKADVKAATPAAPPPSRRR